VLETDGQHVGVPERIQQLARPNWAWPTAPRCSFSPSINCRPWRRAAEQHPCANASAQLPAAAPTPDPAQSSPICEDMSEAPTVSAAASFIGGFCVLPLSRCGIRLSCHLLKPLDSGHTAIAVAARADLTDRNGELLARTCRSRILRPSASIVGQGASARRPGGATAPMNGPLAAFTMPRHPCDDCPPDHPDAEAKVMHLGLPGWSSSPRTSATIPTAGARPDRGRHRSRHNGVSGWSWDCG